MSRDPLGRQLELGSDDPAGGVGAQRRQGAFGLGEHGVAALLGASEERGGFGPSLFGAGSAGLVADLPRFFAGAGHQPLGFGLGGPDQCLGLLSGVDDLVCDDLSPPADHSGHRSSPGGGAVRVAASSRSSARARSPCSPTRWPRAPTGSAEPSAAASAQGRATSP